MKITVEYETEIPAAAVPLVPDLAVQLKTHPPYVSVFQSSDLAAGGGRKGFLIFSFDTDEPGKSFRIERADFGTTHIYGPASTRRRAGGFWWDHEILSGKKPFWSKALERTAGNLNARFESQSGSRCAFSFYIHGQLPLMPYKTYTPDYWVKAAIDGAFTLTIDATRRGADLRLAGSHDGFPKHMIRINTKDAYVHDPLLTGDSPASLMGAMERKVDKRSSL